MPRTLKTVKNDLSAVVPLRLMTEQEKRIFWSAQQNLWGHSDAICFRLYP